MTIACHAIVACLIDCCTCRYLQGIKFYEPELASDTPRAVDFDGMRALLAAVSSRLGTEEGESLLSTGGPAVSEFVCSTL